MKVISGQCLCDIAVQEDGNIETVFDWALKNNKSITSKLTAGETLVDPNSALKNKPLSDYFQGMQKKIATATTNQDQELIVTDEGIGAMIIEDTFIIR